MEPNGHKPIRIILGPTPWPIDHIYKDKNGIETVILKKIRGKEASNSRNYIYYDEKTIAQHSGYFPDGNFNQLVDACVKDPMCHYLAERNRSHIFEGTFLSTSRIVGYIYYVLNICIIYRPDIIIFHNYPHDLFTYILLKSTIYLDTKAFIVHFSVLPWCMRISYFTEDHLLKSIKNTLIHSSDLTNDVLKYFKSLRGKYEAAMPTVDMELQNKSRNNFLNIGNEFVGVFKGNPIKHFVRIYLKYQSFRALRNAVVEKPAGDYVVFFLHYQPEESTLPRGGLFAQQIIAISKLRTIIPKNINLIVKEHPSMYRHGHTLSIPVRSKGFYRNISRLSGVYIIPQETNAFKLIDNALAVATITGTVAIEALSRGKSVICFGEPYYKNYSGVTCYQEMNEATDKVFDLQPHDPKNTHADLINEISYSFGNDRSTYSSDAEAKQAAALVAYKYIFSHLSELVTITTADNSNTKL